MLASELTQRAVSSIQLAPPKDYSPGLEKPRAKSVATAPDGLDEFVHPFAATFRRRDQARLFQIYLRGLLHEGPRKSIEAMVRVLDGEFGSPMRDLAQALQNFLNQSPWDEQLLWRQLRQAAVERMGRAAWIGVLDEVSIVKQGHHSVGVHRQYAEDCERKQNCQVAIVLTAVAPDGAFPLACRLYLPRPWAGDAPRLRAAGVPDEYQAAANRGHVALSLLDEVLAEGIRFRAVVAAARFGAMREFREGLERRGGAFVVAVDDDLLVHPEPTGGFAPFCPLPIAQPVRKIDPSGAWLSFDGGDRNGCESRTRFAGQRTLVAADADDSDPLWLLIEQRENRDREHFLARGDVEFRLQNAGPLFKSRQQSQCAWQTMKARFGLDHFEGRSWRGFHHHAALVALAHWHALLASRSDAASRDVIF